jgi:hypothetical protein
MLTLPKQSFVSSRLAFARTTSIAKSNKCQGDYCDVYLTHDSMSVRKAHNTGKNHLRNVVDYYQRTKPPRSLAPRPRL